MNHSTCTTCQIRFTPGQAAGLPACPVCGNGLEHLTGPQAAIGLALYEPDIDAQSLPEAIAAAMPIPPSS
jgi:hypothetical protein